MASEELQHAENDTEVMETRESAESTPAVPDYLASPNAVFGDEGVQWRYGRAPDYTKTRKVWAEGKQDPFQFFHIRSTRLVLLVQPTATQHPEHYRALYPFHTWQPVEPSPYRSLSFTANELASVVLLPRGGAHTLAGTIVRSEC